MSIAADPVNNNESSEAQRMVENDDKAVGAEWKGAVDNKAGEELEGMKNERKTRRVQPQTNNVDFPITCCAYRKKRNLREETKDEIALVAIETSVGNIYHAHFEDDTARAREIRVGTFENISMRNFICGRRRRILIIERNETVNLCFISGLASGIF